MTALPALALNDVSIRYGSFVAVERLSFQVQRGEMFGLLGPNGSGKSSTLMAIAGVLEPFAGSIRIEGLARHEAPETYAHRLGFVPQEIALYEELTAFDNLALFGSLYGLSGHHLHDRVSEALTRVGMLARARERVGRFSGGMKRRINLACALLHRPTVLLLDEPTVALDPASRDSLFVTLDELREQGQAIVLTTHHLDEAESFCDRVGILRQGKLVALGRPADLVRATRNDALLYGHLAQHVDAQQQQSLRERLAATGVDLEVTGKRVRLSARDHEALGQALAVLLTEGMELESFRTPPVRLERLFRNPVPSTKEVA